MQVGNIITDKLSSAKRKKKTGSGSGFGVSGNDEEMESNAVSQAKVNVSSLCSFVR